MICAHLISPAHSDSDNGCAANRKHGGDSNNKCNKRHTGIDCSQSGRSNALADKNTVNNVLRIGYKQTAYYLIASPLTSEIILP